VPGMASTDSGDTVARTKLLDALADLEDNTRV
jgi:hypothetical protein